MTTIGSTRTGLRSPRRFSRRITISPRAADAVLRYSRGPSRSGSSGFRIRLRWALKATSRDRAGRSAVMECGPVNKDKGATHAVRSWISAYQLWSHGYEPHRWRRSRTLLRTAASGMEPVLRSRLGLPTLHACRPADLVVSETAGQRRGERGRRHQTLRRTALAGFSGKVAF